MARTRIMSVQKKPKDWSVGIFVAGCLWVVGASLFHLGTNLLYLIAILVLSYVVDTAFTGHANRKDVYIDRA